MTREISLKFRFLLVVTVIAVVALGGTGVILVELFRQEIARQVETRLSAHLDRLSLLVELKDNRPALREPPLEPRFAVPYSGLYWQIDGPEGAVLRSRSLWDASLTPGVAPGPNLQTQRFLDGPDGAAIVTLEQSILLEDSGTPWHLMVAISAGEVEEPVEKIRWTVVLSFGGLAIVLLLGSVLAVWSGTRPLARLRLILNRVRARQADRLEGRFPTELQPLVDELNDLLEDRDSSIRRARTQAGNLAHALKTPLSIIANEAETLGRQGDGERARTLRDATGSMERNIQHQLARSRAAAAARDVGLGAEVAPIVQRLAQTMSVLHRERAVHCDIGALGDLGKTHLRIDAEDLTEILGNLLDNAFVWAASRVHVSGEAIAPARHVIHIDDDGPGLTDAEIANVLQRGERLDESRPGSGLGLSIVSDLVELFDGEFVLDRSELGGTRASVTLPRMGGDGGLGGTRASIKP